ncbi:MAG: hypothetical protein EOP93_12835, partial [Lysobacteraceae bacterium]
MGLALALWIPVLAGVSQQPLLQPATPADAPNLVLTLDDSSSMGLRHLPDNASPFSDARRWQAGFHPGDAPGDGLRSDRSGTPLTWTTRATDRASALMRSAQHNRLYYDPAVRYRPWARSDGSTLPDADPKAAWRDPVAREALGPGAAVDLTGEQTVGDGFWCHAGQDAAPSPAQGATCTRQPGERFAPASYYVWTGVPSAPGSGFARLRVMDAAEFERPASRTDCAARGSQRLCTQAQEYRNFANWFAYHRTRLYTAIASVSQALAAQEDTFRLGYGSLGQGRPLPIDGQPSSTLVRGLRPFSGPDRVQFFAWLHALRAVGDTPLRRAMDDVGRYYSRARADDPGSPWAATPGSDATSLQSPCRRAYHLLVTDGGWNGAPAASPAARANNDGVDGPVIEHADGKRRWHYRAGAPWRDAYADTLADVALYYYARDLNPQLPNALTPRHEGDAFWQAMVNLTVGFGTGGTLDPARDLAALTRGERRWPEPVPGEPSAIDDLWHAALNSGGQHVNALDPGGLAQALALQLREVQPRWFSTAGIALSTTGSAAARKYVPRYQTLAWTGDLEAYALDDSGTATEPLWRASEQVPAHASRNLWTWNAALRQPLRFDAASLSAAALEPADAALVDYLRGDRSREGAPWRRRAGVLGDIVNSQPLVVSQIADRQYQFLPIGTPGRESYQAFVRAMAKRAGLIFFGANDGMLHAVRESDGVEVFGFVPAAVRGLLERLSRPAYAHRFFLDGPVVEGEGWWLGGWHAVLLASAGAGAPSVFALDVTDTRNPGAANVLWEYGVRDDPHLGHVMAPPETGQLRSGQWVAVFGNGLGGVRLVRDAHNQVVAAYAGDVRGQLWRFNLNAVDPAEWHVDFDGQPLFVAQDAQGRARPITAAPEYIDHPMGGQLVLTGTGKLLEDVDVGSQQVQALHGLWDRVPATRRATAADRILSYDVLAAHAFDHVEVERRDAQGGGTGRVSYDTVRASAVDWRTQRGWYLPLVERLRDVYGARFEKGFARFRLVAPPAVDVQACDTELPAGLDLQLHPLTGAMPPVALFDTNGDGLVSPLD